ncbi:MAG: hypothetical protein R3D90_13320 [Paracoccaceae bacterium]
MPEAHVADAEAILAGLAAAVRQGAGDFGQDVIAGAGHVFGGEEDAVEAVLFAQAAVEAVLDPGAGGGDLAQAAQEKGREAKGKDRAEKDEGQVEVGRRGDGGLRGGGAGQEKAGDQAECGGRGGGDPAGTARVARPGGKICDGAAGAHGRPCCRHPAFLIGGWEDPVPPFRFRPCRISKD